jgi:hypothetical protein
LSMKGRVYVIKSKQTTDIYFGSTIQSEYERMREHNKDYKKYVVTQKKYISSFEIIKFGDAYMEMLEEHEEDTKEELIATLKAREGNYIQTVTCVNRYVPARTHKQWAEDNKESQSVIRKKYREDHKAEIKVKNDQHYKDHREARLEAQKKYTAEHKEECKARMKKYAAEHKEEANARSKKYREDHKEEQDAYMVKYREDHKEAAAIKAKARYQAKKAANAS